MVKRRLVGSKKGTRQSQALARFTQFAHEYMIDRNATRAAIACGYGVKNARDSGHNTLHRPEVQALIQKLEAERLDRLKMTADEVLVGLARVAKFDVRKLYDENGNLKPVSELDDDTALAVAGIEVEIRHERAGEDQPPVMVETKKIKASDRMKALNDLGRHHGLFEKDNKQQQPILFDVSFG